MLNPNPEILVRYIRGRIVEQQHWGFVVLAEKNHIIDSCGDTSSYPFYLRSCAKPLQASLLVDLGAIDFYRMTEEEIALCCASHAGESVHVEIAAGLLEKIGLDESYLKCGFHKPISKTEQNKLVLSGNSESILQNNCVGKHIMMLGLCKLYKWDLATYCESEHPLQIMIKDKITELCELKHNYPMTVDGCGVPIISMPLFNIAKGYLNMFKNPCYEVIKNAILNNPYILGGEDRLDTKIIENSNNLIAKVGAGGLCVVVNLEKEECLVVKISDCDMKARELVTLDSLKNLKWTNIPTEHDILTLHGEKIGEIVTTL